MIIEIAIYSIFTFALISSLFIFSRVIQKKSNWPLTIKSIIRATLNPLGLLIFFYSLHSFLIYSNTIKLIKNIAFISALEWIDNTLIIFMIATGFLISYRLIKILMDVFFRLYEKNRFTKTLFPYLKNSLFILLFLLACNILLPYVLKIEKLQNLFSTLFNILFIISVTWIIINIIHSAETFTIEKYANDSLANLTSRKIVTQVAIIKKIAITVICLFSLIFILMTIENFRFIGETLLASAGVLAAITTFAAQKTLSNIFSGIHLALSQPIRMNDTVVVEKELGIVEEITLTYIVVRIWDLRRIIVPLSYFIEKPFESWTRTSPELLGTVFIYLDYKIPIHTLREDITKMVSTIPSWNKKLFKMDLTELKSNCIEIRLLISASTADALWELRCAIREAILIHLKTRYPESFPKIEILLTRK